MRILALNQFYAPDHSATSQILTDLCEDLVAAGDDVTVIASRGTYQGGRTLAARETVTGVRVLRPWATSLGKRTTARRVVDYASFWATGVAQAAAEARPDVILVLTTPPLIAVGAAVVATIRRIPLVCWVQDVYPDLAVQLGVLSPTSPAVAPLAALARRTYRSSSRIVALSDGMAERLRQRGASRDRLRVIANWADGELLRPVARRENSLRRSEGITDRFVVMYSGNLGAGHEIKTLIEAARDLETKCPRALFMFVGDGGRRPEAERLAEGLTNVRFLPYQPRVKLADSLSAADVHIVSLREHLEGLIVPSKFYGAIACGRPVFYVGPKECEVARAIRADNLGWTGRPGDVAGLAQAIHRAAEERDVPEALHERIRAVFLARYDRRRATLKWRETLQDAVH